MKVLLVNPPCRAPDLVPLGLGYIASTLRENAHEITLLDLNAENSSIPELEKELERLEYDVIGIGGLSTTYAFVKQFSFLAKKVNPKTKIVAGNMVSTVHAELLLQNSKIDVCVIDEGEEAASELISKIGSTDISGVNGIAFRKGQEIIKTPPRERIRNLDKLPFPAWDLFPMETYITGFLYRTYGKRGMSISSVRGCPFQCVYCSRPFGSRLYRRSVESVVSEIKALIKRYKIGFISFTDDLFTIDKRWIMAFCDALIKEHIRIGWDAAARVNLVDPDMLKTMKKAGCKALSFGFESGSQKILDIMKKGVTVGQAERAVEMTRKSGIRVLGSFMIGMAGESEETIEETVEFIKRTGLSLHRFFYTTPYPKTPLYETAKKMGRIPEDEDAYVSSLGEMREKLTVNLTDMPDEKLKSLKQKAEEKIKENFSLRNWKELFSDDFVRISADMRKRIYSDGIMPTLDWSLGKIMEKIKR